MWIRTVSREFRQLVPGNLPSERKEGKLPTNARFEWHKVKALHDCTEENGLRFDVLCDDLCSWARYDGPHLKPLKDRPGDICPICVPTQA